MAMNYNIMNDDALGADLLSVFIYAHYFFSVKIILCLALLHFLIFIIFSVNSPTQHS